MAKCITFNATQRKELVNLVGYNKAEELINKYKVKIPEEEIIKGINYPKNSLIFSSRVFLYSLR